MIGKSKDQFPRFIGFKDRPLLTLKEGAAINKCAKKRGIKGIGVISKQTVLNGVVFK